MGDKKWLDEMWYSGYCNDAVEMASTTELGPIGGAKRIRWLKDHIGSCVDCRFAAMFKNMEGEIAQQLGVFDEFERGGDVTKHPGYKGLLQRYMSAGVQMGVIDGDVQEWMDRVVERRGKPWPGRIQ